MQCGLLHSHRDDLLMRFFVGGKESAWWMALDIDVRAKD